MSPDGAGPSNGGSELDLEIGLERVARPGNRDGQTNLTPGLPVGSSQPQQQPVGSSQGQQPVANIPKVRKQLRLAAGEHLFTPVTMPIGPYHQKKESSFTSTEEKNKAVEYLESLGANFVYLKRVLAALGPEVRRCYSHLPHNRYNRKTFSHMLLHDGCYLLHFFIDYVQQGGAADSLQGGGSRQDIQTKDNTIVRDILYLLENQMPLFVLYQMHSIIARREGKSALEFIARPVEDLLQEQLYISKTTRPLPPESTVHLLHLVHSYFEVTTQPKPGAAPRCSLTGRWRRATDYSRYADLKFKPRRFEPHDKWTILDIDLQGGTLYIPFLRVGSSTLTMLRNMMALEEQQEKRAVTAYCYFMSQLACTEADVDLLQRANILEHFLGSDEQAAKGFAELCNGVALDMDKLERNYLKPFWHNLENRYHKPGRTFMGFFRLKYWSNLFYRLAFLAALLLFLCQVTQSIYAVIAYHKPPKA